MKREVKMKNKISIVIIFCIVTLSNLYANEDKFSGLMFGDVYWVAANHDSALKNQNGIRFRRIFFTYNNKLSDVFSIRFRLEANSSGDFLTKSKMYPFIKDAYVKWKLGKHSIYLGLSPSPTWEFVEKLWGYRSVEKTLMALQKLGSSRDMGIAFKGSLDQNNKVQYHLIIGDGNGESSENDKGKKVMCLLTVELVKNLFLHGYVDWNDLPAGKDCYSIKGFLCYKTSSFRAAAQFVHQTRQHGNGIDDQELKFGSVFAAAKIGNKIWGLARMDRAFDPNPDSEKIS